MGPPILGHHECVLVAAGQSSGPRRIKRKSAVRLATNSATDSKSGASEPKQKTSGSNKVASVFNSLKDRYRKFQRKKSIRDEIAALSAIQSARNTERIG